MLSKKMNDCLNSFVEDCVSLNENRIDRIDKGIEVVNDLLKHADPFKKLFIDLEPQGSFRHGTAIRPVSDEDDFDLDLLLRLRPVPSWEPRDYLKHVHDFFYSRDRYREIVDRRGKTRCVTLDYESDFHIDIVLSIQVGTQWVIFNKNTNMSEPTDGEGYAEWFATQNAITQGNLAKIVKLIKYIRDSKGSFSIKSVVLTTLLGLQVSRSDAPICYVDLVTTCQTILFRLDTYLQANPTMPRVANPALQSELFTSRHWTQEQYANFRNKFNEYSVRILAALEGGDDQFESEMVDIFGEECMPQTAPSPILSISPYTVAVSFPSSREEHIDSYINGSSPAPIILIIDADIKRMRFLGRRLSQIGRGLLKNATLKFFVKLPRHIDKSQHTLYWKVRNTGEEARIKGQLRGEITRDNGSFRKTETTLYSGAHYVEV